MAALGCGCFRSDPTPPPLRHNETLDYEGLRREAETAAGGHRQADLAEALGVSQPAVSMALREAGPKRASLQRQIIEALTDFVVEEELLFRIRRKSGATD